MIFSNTYLDEDKITSAFISDGEEGKFNVNVVGDFGIAYQSIVITCETIDEAIKCIESIQKAKKTFYPVND